MHRVLLALALVAACGENGPDASPRVLVDPILDSLFVGDTRPARTVTYLDARGDAQPTGPVVWTSSDPQVLSVDASTGEIAGEGPGVAVLSARANGVTGTALLAVSRTLDVALLIDTIYLMEGDVFTVPVAVRDRDGSPPPATFSAPANAVFSIDPATGTITAKVPGGPLPFTVHADMVTVSGVVEVVQLTDTAGGKASFSVFGTVIRRARAGARAVQYLKQGGDPAFRLSTPIVVQGVSVENIVITLPDPVVLGGLPLGAISPDEAFGAGADPICRPPGAWSLWSTQAFTPTLRALSQGGVLTVRRIVAIPHGQAISGDFVFTGQRTDLFDNPLAALTIRGTFVAPLITDDGRQCG